jgi:hypothetical protein
MRLTSRIPTMTPYRLGLFGTKNPAIAQRQCKKKYGDQHWPAEHLNKQPSVIFKVTTIITPTVAIDNQASWVAFPERHCGPSHRTDNPDTPKTLPPIQLASSGTSGPVRSEPPIKRPGPKCPFLGPGLLNAGSTMLLRKGDRAAPLS